MTSKKVGHTLCLVIGPFYCRIASLQLVGTYTCIDIKFESVRPSHAR